MSQQIPTEFLPHDSYVGELRRVNIAFICANSVIIIVRLIVRGFVVKHVAVDDYLMVAAGLCADVFSALAIVGMPFTRLLQKGFLLNRYRRQIWSGTALVRSSTKFAASGQHQERDSGQSHPPVRTGPADCN
jgi:hypothetical protein